MGTIVSHTHVTTLWSLNAKLTYSIEACVLLLLWGIGVLSVKVGWEEEGESETQPTV